MDKLKRFLKYIFCIIGFFILSEFLINVGLNSTYKNMETKQDILPPQIEIYQAESTSVNGRIRGIIKKDKGTELNGKYVKFDFFSPRDVNLGTKYIEIDNSEEDMPFEAFFKLNNVSYYTADIVDKKDEIKGEIEFIPEDLKRPEILLATAMLLVMSW